MWRKRSYGAASNTAAVSVMGLHLWFCASHVSAMQPSEALLVSAETGRPLLAMATSATCPPCQKLKRNLATHWSVAPLAEKFIILEMDSGSPEFHRFLQRYPAEYRGVPMIFMIRPDGASLYGQSGGMPPDALRDSLQFGLDHSGTPPTSEQQISFDKRLDAAELLFQKGELPRALELATLVAKQPSSASTVQESRRLRNSILDAVNDRLARLNRRLANAETMHGAAFRLAELCVRLGDVPPRETAKSMLLHYQQRESTRLAVAQGWELVRAREYERQGSLDQAVASYKRIITFDEASPTADHSLQKLAIIRARRRRELASRPSSG